ncbi:MAG: radical SAM protein [Deltaproteobacteria bacterium]|nr:radical SAM protein [Deltaproteobacteria bacterium]
MNRTAVILRLAAQMRDFALRRERPACPPFRLWVDLTSRCNLACPACPQRLLPPEERRDLSPDILAGLVREVPELGVEVNLFHRGEPLLHPHFAFWARRFARASRQVRVHSNATLLTTRRAAAVVAGGVAVFTCSVDSLDPAAYALARPGASLERTLAGVERLLLTRRAVGARRPVVNLLTMGPAAPDPAAEPALRRLSALGLDRVSHRRPHNWGGAVPGPVGSAGPAACTFPWYGLAVLSDGRVTPCPQDFFGRLTLGRLPDQSLREIWQGEAARRLRRAHARRDLGDYPGCAACDRVRRPTLASVPWEHLVNFLREAL